MHTFTYIQEKIKITALRRYQECVTLDALCGGQLHWNTRAGVYIDIEIMHKDFNRVTSIILFRNTW